MFLSNSNKEIAVELKYKTKHVYFSDLTDDFSLKDDFALDQARFDFLKDISTLETFVDLKPSHTGYAIFLSNNPTYWKSSNKKKRTNDQAFRFFQGNVLSGKLSWAEDTSEGVRQGRTEFILLKRQYVMNWESYSDLGCKNGVFRYLLVKIV